MEIIPNPKVYRLSESFMIPFCAYQLYRSVHQSDSLFGFVENSYRCWVLLLRIWHLQEIDGVKVLQTAAGAVIRVCKQFPSYEV